LFKAVHRFVDRFVDFDAVEVVDVDWIGGRVHVRAVPTGSLVEMLPVAEVHFSLRRSVVHTCTQPIVLPGRSHDS
jgi:hypothetical protein